MTPKLYKGYLNFEHYWQSGKVWDFVDHHITLDWWKTQTEPHRRYPKSRGKKVLHAIWNDTYPGIKMDYITSRKLVYVPEYYNLVKETSSIKKWRKLLEDGNDIVIYDFDGPRAQDGSPICDSVDLNLLKTKINDITFPFGHGYVVAALLAGITLEEFCSP
jgi:hypothetical protein